MQNDESKKNYTILLVDDEDDFRQSAAQALQRRGFTVQEAPDGIKGLEEIERRAPDIVVLDLKMPGPGGIETLQKIRKIAPRLPVIILTGHGSFSDAVAGIELEITEFLQKPVDVGKLGEHIRDILRQPFQQRVIQEKTIQELMVEPSLYPSVKEDNSVVEAFHAFNSLFSNHDDETSPRLRSALVTDEAGRFKGMLRFHDLLQVILPPFLEDSPWTSYFTGMFLAQCKLIGNRKVRDLLDDTVSVSVDAPLMEAVHLMAANHVVNLPVMKGDELVGILRERSVIQEILACLPKHMG